MSEIKIGNKYIGDKHPCFIIAEAGVNHNGNLDLAKKLIDAAANAGVDAVKFQVLRTKGLYVENAGKVNLDTGKEVDLFQMWKDVEMPATWIPELKSYCENKKVLFFSSVFDELAVDMLDPYVNLYKIASSELTHIPLLKKVAKTGKPIIISLGSATLDEIDEGIASVMEEGNNSIALLQCIQKYPTPLSLANVSAVRTLRERYPSLVIGYSDHSMEPGDVPSAAVALGGRIIEKHFTLSREMEGIDHKMSLEPNELYEMVREIRETERRIKQGINIDISPELLGSGEFFITDDNKKVRSLVQRKIFAIKPVSQGEKFSADNIAVLRPGHRNESSALHPREYFKVLNSKALRDIPPLSIIKNDDLESILKWG